MGSIELGLSVARAAFKTRRDLRDPSRRHEILLGGRSEIEQRVVEQYVSRHKRWGTLIGFMSNFAREHGIPSAEIPGLTDVMLLVMTVDKIIDKPGEFKEAMPPNEFRSKLLESKIDGTEYTVGQLLQITQERYVLSPAKRAVLDGYLDHAITVQATLGAQIPGEYTYEDAVAYREATNSAGIDMGFYLADIHAPRLIAAAKQYIRLVQIKDDLEDVGQDFREKSMNLFLGMATRYSDELQALQTAMIHPEFAPDRVWMQVNMPNTFIDYSSQITQEEQKDTMIKRALQAQRLLLRRRKRK